MKYKEVDNIFYTQIWFGEYNQSLFKVQNLYCRERFLARFYLIFVYQKAFIATFHTTFILQKVRIKAFLYTKKSKLNLY